MRARTLAAVLVLLSWSRADACKCAVEPTAIEALGRSDAVFVGTVVDQRSDLFLDGVYSGPTITYDVAVRRAWKGVSAERLSLRRVPELKFIYDESVAAQDRIEQIILEIHAEDAARTVDSPDFVETPADAPADGATDAPPSDEAKPGDTK